MKIDGVAWLLFRQDFGAVLMERCPKKAEKMGVGEWFIPGGKIEGDENDVLALFREIGEEWPGVELRDITALPLVQASPIVGELFLMRPFIVNVFGNIPSHSADGPELRWFSTLDALLLSPVAQVRMMVAAALTARDSRRPPWRTQ